MCYREKYAVGTLVRIASTERLNVFMREWTLHHPLELKQLAFAGRVDRVRSVGFYHGGDVLYTLENAPGTWHEQLLLPG
jgi:hypothetical protein